MIRTFLQVDLEYPSYLHEAHKDQPLAPQSLEITEDMLCDIAKGFLNHYQIKYQTQTRLTQTLYNKKNYVLHINNLKFYIEQGLILTKIHRGIKFIQTKWLKPYIDLNTQKRVMATSKFEKNFFKLLVNSIYGKCLENVRKYRDVKIVTSEFFAQRYANKKKVKSYTILEDDLVTIDLQKEEVKLSKPVFAGMVRNFRYMILIFMMFHKVC